MFVGNKIANSGGFFGVLAVAAYPTASYCGVPNSLGYNSLLAVPWNSSAAWISAFPELANILDDNPCYPAHNVIANNTICGAQPCSWSCASYNTAAAPYVWGCCSSPAQIVGWNSSISGNVVNVTCPSLSPSATPSQSPSQTQSESQLPTSSQTPTSTQLPTRSQLPTSSQSQTPSPSQSCTLSQSLTASNASTTGILDFATVTTSPSATVLSNSTSGLGGDAVRSRTGGSQGTTSVANFAVLGLAVGLTLGALATIGLAVFAAVWWRKRSWSDNALSSVSPPLPGGFRRKRNISSSARRPPLVSWRKLDVSAPPAVVSPAPSGVMSGSSRVLATMRDAPASGESDGVVPTTENPLQRRAQIQPVTVTS